MVDHKNLDVTASDSFDLDDISSDNSRGAEGVAVAVKQPNRRENKKSRITDLQNQSLLDCKECETES